MHTFHRYKWTDSISCLKIKLNNLFLHTLHSAFHLTPTNEQQTIARMLSGQREGHHSKNGGTRQYIKSTIKNLHKPVASLFITIILSNIDSSTFSLNFCLNCSISFLFCIIYFTDDGFHDIWRAPKQWQQLQLRNVSHHKKHFKYWRIKKRQPNFTLPPI